jgi:hypothetical protein
VWDTNSDSKKVTQSPKPVDRRSADGTVVVDLVEIMSHRATRMPTTIKRILYIIAINMKGLSYGTMDLVLSSLSLKR